MTVSFGRCCRFGIRGWEYSGDTAFFISLEQDQWQAERCCHFGTRHPEGSAGVGMGHTCQLATLQSGTKLAYLIITHHFSDYNCNFAGTPLLDTETHIGTILYVHT